jgi:hypothetical protein
VHNARFHNLSTTGVDSRGQLWTHEDTDLRVLALSSAHLRRKTSDIALLRKWPFKGSIPGASTVFPQNQTDLTPVSTISPKISAAARSFTSRIALTRAAGERCM